MKHAVRFRVTTSDRGAVIHEHRPAGPEAYTYVMPDGRPATDEERAEADDCEICFPVGPSTLVDNGPAS